AVDRQIAERAEVAAAAIDRQVHVDRSGAGRPSKRAGGADADRPPLTVEIDGARADTQRRARITRRHLEQIAVGSRGDVARRGGLARAVAREIYVVSVGADEIALPIGVTGDVPMPLRLVPIQGCSKMRA